MIECYDRGAVGVIPGGGVHELYVTVHDRLVDGDYEEAATLHHELLPLLNHIGQSAEMFIQYEKLMFAERGFIAVDRCRTPTFTPDEFHDRMFMDIFELLRERCNRLATR